jgi:hypothetical protein
LCKFLHLARNLHWIENEHHKLVSAVFFNLRKRPMKHRLGKFLTSLLFAGLTASAQAQTAGGPDDGFIGCDGIGECRIQLDEFGNIVGSFGGFFGPYDITLSHIAPTVDAAYAGLEVTSYSVVGKGSFAPFRLTAGAMWR